MREEDVVYVYPDAGCEVWQDFKKLVTNVAAELHGVTGVDKENVVGFKTREEIDVELFDSFLNQLNVWANAVESLGVRLDTGQLAVC